MRHSTRLRLLIAAIVTAILAAPTLQAASAADGPEAQVPAPAPAPVPASVQAPTPAATPAPTPDPLWPIRAAMRNNHYAAALALADALLQAAGDGADEAAYLKALALQLLGRHEEAIGAADVLLRQHSTSAWRHKSLFLKASSLVQLRRFKDAESIYEDDAFRLLSGERKQEIAAVLIQLADALATEPDPNDPGAAPADHAKAATFYERALEVEIGRDLRDDVLFKQARALYDAEDRHAAIERVHAYLNQFDPEWMGPVGSAERMRRQKRQNPPPAGRHVLEMRYLLGKSQIGDGRLEEARQNFDDLLAMVRGLPDGVRRVPAVAQLEADTGWQIVRTHNMPDVAADAVEHAATAAREFLSRHPDHRHAVEAAWLIGQAYRNAGRPEEAAAQLVQFIDGALYRLPEGAAATEPIERLGRSPAELDAEWKPLAHFQLGEIRFGQRNYAQAIEWWQRYVTRFPSGPHWSASQRQVIDAAFLFAIDRIAEGDEAAGETLLRAFLEQHPLDARAAQVLFILGQMRAVRGDIGAGRAAWMDAIQEWARLIGKYPNTEESSLALYRTGVLQEEKLGDLEAALDSYRRLTWGSWAGAAQARIGQLTAKHLVLRTDRTFRSNETAQVKLDLRNVERLTIRQYVLDPEAYFRKTHTTGGVERLDISLIEPDTTWEVAVDAYSRYLPITQSIDIPFPEGRAGVCVVNVSEDDLEATTLIIRSDLELVMRTSRREMLVYVQDMVAQRPAADVKVLISDGQTVLAVERTGTDGVLRRSFKELAGMNGLSVFALRDGHMASNGLDLNGLQLSSGLASTGYICTDRPAYRPGHTVGARGILRTVTDGSYHAPAGTEWLVALVDSQGRVLHEEPVTLSEFGSFSLALPLSERAAVGEYAITARPKASPGPVFRGSFLVEEFELRKMQLAFEFDRDVAFRGETVKATLTATYAWGEPVAGIPVAYTLPDGRGFEERTDADGRIAIGFDTAGMQAGPDLIFAAAIGAEDVRAVGRVAMPEVGFAIAVKPSQPLVLSGEPFDVTIDATAPTGKPVSVELTVRALRSAIPKPHPVLDEVPWLDQVRPNQAALRRAADEQVVAEHRVKTDAVTGRALLRLELAQGGPCVLRVSGIDRFGQTVAGEARVEVSDNDDTTRLRLLAAGDTLKVGEQATVRLHSRVKSGLALVTLEGETIIEHRVVPVVEGFNPLALAVGHEHFPNFALSVCVMDGRELRTASRQFSVERQLKVTVRPPSDALPPRSMGDIEILVTDQLGRPVRAELSLAMVDEALLSLFPDTTPDILNHFQAGARRHVEFRTIATNGFEYVAATCNVLKAFREETERLAQVEEEGFKVLDSSLSEVLDMVAGARMRRAMPEPAQVFSGQITQDRSAGDVEMFAKNVGRLGADERSAAPPPPRREELDAGWWAPSIVTGADGRAVVTITMPDKTARWRLVARGASVETLVGQATASLVTRADFFVEIKAPSWAMEGDRVRILSRIHNLAKLEGPAEITLTVASGSQQLAQSRGRLSLSAGQPGEFLFDPFEVPAVGELEFTVSARAGGREDALRRVIPVQPWGLPYAAHGGGVASRSTGLQLELPKKLPYTSRWLTIAVGPDLNQLLVDLALGRGAFTHAPSRGSSVVPPAPPEAPGGSGGSALLASLAGLEYARSAPVAAADVARLSAQARAQVSALVASQQAGGGWSWRDGEALDWAATSMNSWSLRLAQQLGLAVPETTMLQAETALANAYQSAASADHESKTVILHALAQGPGADFNLANALYRERNGLAPLHLAQLAITLKRLDRGEMAGEVLDLLERSAVEIQQDGRTLCSWPARTDRYPWLHQEEDVAAMALLAFLEVRPESPRVAQLTDLLLQRRGAFACSSGRLGGAAILALGRSFGRGAFAGDDFRLTILVNDKAVATLERRAGSSPAAVEVTPELIVEGSNRVRFEMEGRGHFAFAATLRGFSPVISDPKSWSHPLIYSRSYIHAPLTYRGVPIKAASSSRVENIQIGQRVQVRVDVYETGYNGYLVVEEPLPAGMVLVPGSLTGGNVAHHEVRDGRLIMYIARGQSVHDYSYELAGYATGTYRVLPTVLRDAVNPGRMRLGQSGQLVVLSPGEASSDPYAINDAERLALATAYFEDGLYREAGEHLWPLFDREQKYAERQVARMLLWIHTSPDFFDARRVVDAFEVLTVRHPELTIPFDRILVVGQAYRSMGEFERAWLVYRATIDSSFISDSNMSAILQDEGQLLASLDFQEGLWWQYPDTTEVASSLFALSQLYYEHAARARELAEQPRQVRLRVPGRRGETAPPSRATMLAEAIRLLDTFRTRHPSSPLSDDAAFSLANAYLDLKDYAAVVDLSEAFKAQYGESVFATSFQYMVALGHFWRRAYEPALSAARVVADGESKDRDFARYILGQIHHAQGKPAEAIEWYRTVSQQYPDAREAIDYFEAKRIALEEVNTFHPGKPVSIEIEYRNIREAQLQVYRVDLMKLYLREKNLSRITQVNLAGIEPQLVTTLTLGDGREYADKKLTTELKLHDEGAYLVICRGDDLFASGLVLITPLAMEVQEDPASGRARVNVIDEVTGLRPDQVHVKAIGSGNSGFQSGETDLRGIYVADGLRGRVTAIARDRQARYAFYRGEQWVGAPELSAGRAARAPDAADAGRVDYEGNLRLQNDELQQNYNQNWDKLRRSGEKGVQVDKTR